MRFLEIVICAILLSFMAGLIYSTQGRSLTAVEPKKVERVIPNAKGGKLTDVNVTYDDVMAKQALMPCSKVNTMPCEVSPTEPVKEELDAKAAVINNEKLFVKGEGVTCIYPAVFSWDNGDEFIENRPIKCTVIEASEEFADLEPNYQHIKVNCLKDLKTKWSKRPGHGMVEGHKLNYVERWFSSSDCYHFQQAN